MRRWADVLPTHIAARQNAHERAKKALSMRELGFTYVQIGERLEISESRARQLVRHGSKKSPVEKFLETGGDIAALMRP